MTPNQVLDKIIQLYKGYSSEHRASTQPMHLEKVTSRIAEYEYDHRDLLIREPLIEHVGSLPIVASTVYPYINDSEVDLGRALLLLSIHDIGELSTGDEITFTKKKQKAEEERSEALKLLDSYYHDFYTEIEDRKTKTAQFAKSIDKITPDIVDLITPAKFTIERYKKHINKEPEEIVPMIKEFKHPYMVWNPFLIELHMEVLSRLERKINEELKF